MSTSNADTVRAIYAAFGRGDGPAILEHVADDCDWEFAYPADHGIPWLVPRRGRAGAGAFFQSAAEHLQFTRFEVDHVVGEGAVVVAICSLEARVKSTGKVIRENQEAHIWHFDPRGRVVRFRHAADTLQQFRALQS
jgi:ketosteroid isomerase-like protein